VFEFDSDEDELILDDHEKIKLSQVFFMRPVETGVTERNLKKASITSMLSTITWV
jgi:hypothetical protein